MKGDISFLGFDFDWWLQHYRLQITVPGKVKNEEQYLLILIISCV